MVKMCRNGCRALILMVIVCAVILFIHYVIVSDQKQSEFRQYVKLREMCSWVFMAETCLNNDRSKYDVIKDSGDPKEIMSAFHELVIWYASRHGDSYVKYAESLPLNYWVGKDSRGHDFVVSDISSGKMYRLSMHSSDSYYANKEPEYGILSNSSVALYYDIMFGDNFNKKQK